MKFPGMQPGRTATVLALGVAQTLAWGSSFYLPAMLAAPMAGELGLQPSTIYALLSVALIVGAVCGPRTGRLIDRHGGRPVLMASNGLFAAGLLAMAASQGLATLVLAWLLIGLGMSGGLYDAAFAALVRIYGRDARNSITGITLIAGFASTVGWPLTAVMESTWGWRGACAGWAALHLLVALPLNARVPRHQAQPTAPMPLDGAPAAVPPARHVAPLLAAVFGLLSLVSAAIATHMPALLQAGGATRTAAVATAALVGPAQVAARLFEVALMRRMPPLLSARAAALGHPLGAGLFLALGTAGALPFAVVHGLGNGLITIVRGTLPLAVFGSAGYGARQGWLTLPARLLGALSPWLFGIALARWGVQALWLSAALGSLAFGCLLLLHLPPRAGPR